MQPVPRVLYRNLYGLCRNIDTFPHLRILCALELALLRGCRPLVYRDRGTPRESGYAVLLDPEESRRHLVPDLAYSRLKLANICQSRDSRYGEYPEPNPQASNVAFTPVCRGLFTEHVETGAVRQWLEFGQAVTTALRTVVGWAEINMGESFVWPCADEEQSDEAVQSNEALKLWKKGEHAASKGDLATAFRCYDASAKSNLTPHSLTGLAWLHTSSVGQGDEHALELLDLAISLDEEYGNAHFHRGLILRRQSDVEGASAAFNQAKMARIYDWTERETENGVVKIGGRSRAYTEHGQMLLELGYIDAGIAQLVMALHQDMNARDSKGKTVLTKLTNFWNKRKSIYRKKQDPCAQHATLLPNSIGV